MPYVKGVSERVKRTLASMNIQTAFKPMLTLGNVFRNQKIDRLKHKWGLPIKLGANFVNSHI